MHVASTGISRECGKKYEPLIELLFWFVTICLFSAQIKVIFNNFKLNNCAIFKFKICIWLKRNWYTKKIIIRMRVGSGAFPNFRDSDYCMKLIWWIIIKKKLEIFEISNCECLKIQIFKGKFFQTFLTTIFIEMKNKDDKYHWNF